MTIDSEFILFKKTDFNTILACLGCRRGIGDGGYTIFVGKIIILYTSDPPSKENDSL